MNALTQKKPFKFKVHDDNTKVFNNNQVVGAPYMHKPYGERSMQDKIDDELSPFRDVGSLPYREQDSDLKMIADNYPSFPSPITKLSIETGNCYRLYLRIILKWKSMRYLLETVS